ncbi:MAG: ABC transporter permease, partial [Chloroflexota bacterium]
RELRFSHLLPFPRGFPVLAYIARRLLAMIPALIGITFIVFLLIRLVPGDVVDMMLGQQNDLGPERIADLRRYFGLDQPIYVQYAGWAGNILRGDFGVSFRTARPILPDIMQRIPVTVELALLSALLGIVVGVPAGILAAVKRGTVVELAAQFLGFVGLSVPGFWLGAMFILVASRAFGFFAGARFVGLLEDPAGNLSILALPALAVGLSLMASLTRYTRSSMLEVLGQEYIVTARAKGLASAVVMVRHALKNALIPVVTAIGLQFGYLLGGVVIIETVFAVPGLGRLLVDAIYQRDYPMVQAVVLFIAFSVMLINLVVDVAYAYLDPRLRYG